MAEAGSASKVCVKCGADVAGKPRVKDPKGHYLCQACFDRVQGERKGAAGEAAVEAATSSASKSAPKGAAKAQASGVDVEVPAEEGIFGVVDLDALAPVAEVPKPRALKVCPACGKAREQDSVVCVSCGFDERAGFQRGTGVGASAKKGGKIVCAFCGYDLKGIRKPRCPECGKVQPLITEKEDRAAESKAIARKAYWKPILMIVIGLGGLIIMGAAQGKGGATVVELLLKYAIGVPIGLLVYVLCCAIWIGFDAPLHRVTLSLAGIYAVVDLVSAVLGLIPIPVIGWVASIITYIGLMMDELDLDLMDAVIVAFATWFAKMFLAMVLVVMIMNLMQ